MSSWFIFGAGVVVGILGCAGGVLVLSSIVPMWEDYLSSVEHGSFDDKVRQPHVVRDELLGPPSAGVVLTGMGIKHPPVESEPE